jgi:hypothetical protein
MPKINLAQVQLNWANDILRRIEDVIKSNSNEAEKIEIISWLVKQALKNERED